MKRARLEANLSQAKLGAKVGESQNWISECELALRRVSFVEVEDIATACQKPLAFFDTRLGESA